MRTVKAFILVVLWVLPALCAIGQTVQVQVPTTVSCGENFRLSYIVNTQDVEGFRLGELPEGLELITGPYTSRSSSFQIVNGHTTSSSTLTYTYTIYASKNGQYTIPAAKATIGGKSISSNTATVTVTGAPQSAIDKGQRAKERGQTASADAGSGELFITVSANKHRVYEQEPVLLTYKVYTTLDLTSLQGEMPELTGFHVQELPLPQQKSFKIETVNGKQYRTVTWSQYVMFPQKTGTLEVPALTYKGTVMQKVRNIDPFEAFFNGGSAYNEVKKEIKAPSVKIEVDPLPTRPSGFSGGVGQFKLKATADHTEVKAGEPINISVTIEGVGNLKLVKQPQLELPKDFDHYDPKVTDKTKLTERGVEGSMTYDYLIVARNPGEYVIPGVELTYFDTASKAYKTLTTNEITLKVAKGDGKTTVVDYSLVDPDSDIHGVHTGNAECGVRSAELKGYWYWILGPLALFLGLIVLLRRMGIWHDRRQKDVKRAARKRLRKAEKLMKLGKKDEFFDETLRAMWAVAEKKGLTEENKKVVNELVEACELARYGAQANDNLIEIYEKAVDAISSIDNK